jgi:hypothetical protein
MKLSSAIIRNLYSAIYCMKPFCTYKNMPLPEEINFIVDKGEDMGTYLYDPGNDDWEHTITISEVRCGTLDTVLKVLLHECIHMSRHKSSRWTHHDKEFRKRAHRIWSEIGFVDPLEL